MDKRGKKMTIEELKEKNKELYQEILANESKIKELELQNVKLKIGDVIEFKGVKGKIVDIEFYSFDRVFRYKINPFKKDGTLGSAERFIYEQHLK